MQLQSVPDSFLLEFCNPRTDAQVQFVITCNVPHCHELNALIHVMINI
jgi:hypothetical protein